MSVFSHNPLSDRFACPACGSRAGHNVDQILWPELVRAWGLSSSQAAVLNARDGVWCKTCGSNVRTMTLALAMMRSVGSRAPARQLRLRCPLLRLLEVNECGPLREMTGRMPRAVRGDYPVVDMQALPYADASFDLVIHGDTLEHVADPIQGLRECLRVLRPNGSLCYTVPVVVGRPTRRRSELPASYHGASHAPLYLVYTEYGDDFWTEPVAAGFSDVRIISLAFPCSFALVCRR